MPADNIKRAIQRGTGELPGVTYEEITYEGYGPGGAAILVEVVTDNANRTVSELRHSFSRNNGNLGQPGSVAWMFHKKGIITIPRSGKGKTLTEDDIMGIVLEPGAEDLQVESESFTVTTDPQSFEAVRKALEDKGVPMESAQLQMVSQNLVKVTGKEAGQLLKLMEALEEHDDVQNVNSNFDIEEKELAALQNQS
jgi:YebC/PmpR family DNA-binding regulatory protein